MGIYTTHDADVARATLLADRQIAEAPVRIIREEEFRTAIRWSLRKDDTYNDVGCVTGPGRSGAIAAVYASHILGVPFIPFGSKAPTHLGRLLIIDTATDSGRTLRKASRKYDYATPLTLAVYDEKLPYVGRVTFWYEATKSQHFKPEKSSAPR